MFTLSPNLKKIITATLPLCVGLFSIMLVQMVDAIYLSWLGVDQLAVHGMTVPFSAVFTGIQVGIGVAATSIISQALGAEKKKIAKTTASLAFVAGLAFIVLVCFVLLGLETKIFQLFVSEDISPDKHDLLQAIFQRYWPYWLFSACSLALLYFTTCVYRANGDNKKTGGIFVMSSVINCILDPVLIFVLELGIIGAAIASAIAYLTTASYMLYQTKGRDWFNKISFDKDDYAQFSHLVKMTIPTMANQFLPSISAFIGMILIARMGTDAIAFWSLLLRVESFLLVFTLALTMSIPPMIGFYLGAHKIENIDGLLKTTAKFLICSHVSLALLLMLGLKPLVMVLNAQPEIQNWLYNALLVIPLSYGLLGLCMVVVSAFNALGEPKKALQISFTRLFIFYIPAIYIGTSTASVQNTVIAAAIANICAGIAAWIALRKRLNLMLSSQQIEENHS